MKKSIFLAFLLGAVLPGSLSAAMLVQYNFDANSNVAPAFVPTTTEPGVTPTSVSQVGFTSVVSTTNVAFAVRNRAVTLDQIDDTFTTDHYYEFTLTTGVGNALDLTNLTFYFNISAGGTAANNSRYQLRYDNLADGAGFVTVGTTVDATGTTGLLADFDLSGAQFNNLTQGITFRLDVADNGSTNSGASVRLDQLSVNGSVVPEPTATAMLLGGLGLLLGFRRARHRA